MITYQRGRCAWPNFEWRCTTDVPIILFAYISTEPPHKKKGTHIKRGVVFHHAAKVYWSYQLITCQNEDGEVTDHTFTWQVPSDEGTFDWRPPGDNVVFWWRCGGRTNTFFPKWSASRSPFYNARCPKPVGVEITCQLLHGSPQVERYGPNWADAWSGAGDGSAPGTVIMVGYTCDRGNPRFIWRTALYFDTSEIPVGATILSATVRFRQHRWTRQPTYRYGAPIEDDTCLVNAPDCPTPPNYTIYQHLRDCTTIVGSHTWSVAETEYEWIEYPLSAAGLANIVPGGTSIFGLRAL